MNGEKRRKEGLVLENSRVTEAEEIKFTKEKESFRRPDSSGIDNHHNIPRQDYNQWGSNSNTNNNDANGDKDGSG